MHQLVSEHTADLPVIKYLQYPLRAAYHSMAFIAPCCESIRRFSRCNVYPGHRLPGFLGQLAHYGIQIRGFVF